MSWKEAFLQKLEESEIFCRCGFSRIADDKNAAEAAPTQLIELWHIDDKHWQRFAELAAENKFRWAAGWAEQSDEQFYVHACFEKSSNYILLRATINVSKSEILSQATVYAAANRSERHTHDMFGIDFLNHPDPRCWTRHKAWGKHDYPLRHDFSVQGSPAEITPPDTGYHFIQSHGVGVYEIPVGPVHAGIIEPGHFRFQAVGELILNLEERLGYVHKGTEKIAEGRTPEGLAKLAGRVSGDTFKKIFTVGIVTEKYKAPYDEELEALGVEIKRRIDQKFTGSLAIRAVDAGSCNGCELEIHALNNPFYDVENSGFILSHHRATPMFYW